MNYRPRNAGLRRKPISLPCVGRLLSFLTAGLFCFAFNSIAADLWTTAYYPGKAQSVMPVSDIDFTVITHVIHFALLPNVDGSFDETANDLASTNAATLVQLAHAAGRKVLICVGGANSERGFQGATATPNRASFVASLMRYMTSRNYDGIDLDWEPLPASDFPQFTNLVIELRSALDGVPTHKLLTAAVSAYPSYGDPPTSEYALFSTLQTNFDQINIMTYDLSGAYSGWVTWFNSPIFDSGLRFSSTGSLVPSIDGAVRNFTAAAISPAKLGIGIAFYGDVWSGGTGTSTGGVSLPRQTWVIAPTVTQLGYAEIMSDYYRSSRYHWDKNAGAAYLSIDNPGAAGDRFITYDDEHTCRAKVDYARSRGLGGIMIWQLAQDHRPDQPAGSRDPLVQAIQRALAAASANDSHGEEHRERIGSTNRVRDSTNRP